MRTRGHSAIVVRVQPRASEGITDLLSASGYRHLVEDKVPGPIEKHLASLSGRISSPPKKEEGLLDTLQSGENAGY